MKWVNGYWGFTGWMIQTQALRMDLQGNMALTVLTIKTLEYCWCRRSANKKAVLAECISSISADLVILDMTKHSHISSEIRQLLGGYINCEQWAMRLTTSVSEVTFNFFVILILSGSFALFISSRQINLIFEFRKPHHQFDILTLSYFPQASRPSTSLMLI